MSWIPIGPDFSFNPKDQNYKRVSRRNTFGNSCMIWSLTVDPTDNRTIYVIDWPASGGASAFRTRNDAAWWEPIIDDLVREINPMIAPQCIAVNPRHPETIYMGTTYNDPGVFISDRRGDPGSWTAASGIRGAVRNLIIDPNTSADLTRTVIYAATDTGIYISLDGGRTWPADPVLAGDIWSMCAHFPAGGPPIFHAGVFNMGVYYSNQPERPDSWLLLNSGGTGLLPVRDPDSPTANFETALVDFSLSNPARVYAWLIRPDATVALYSTESSPRNWYSVPMTSPPGPAYRYYARAFAVAPNSPGTGDGSSDVLFIGSETIWRSTDGGRTWHNDRGFMSDVHDFKFGTYTPGEIPDTYVGCDGGLARSNLIASPDYVIPIHGTPGYGLDGDYNELEGLPNLGFWQNLNYGRHASSPYCYASDPGISGIGYLALQDGGICGGNTALSWGLSGGFGDGFQVAAKQAATGVRVWVNCNGSFEMYMDNGRPPHTRREGITLGSGGPYLIPTAQNLVLGPDGNCFSGARYTDSSMIMHDFVARTDVNGLATQISPDFASVGKVQYITVHPTDPRTVACKLEGATADTVAISTSADSSTSPWNQYPLPAGIPDGTRLSSLAIDRAGKLLVLLTAQVTRDGDALRSPLLELTGSGLELKPCDLPPIVASREALPYVRFGKIIAHPTIADLFYASQSDRVYRLTWAQMRWNWEDISDGLPGALVNDLWIGNVAPEGAPPRYILRAILTTRSVWELEVTDGAGSPATALYLRDNLLDQWWQNPSPHGVPNPYAPDDPGQTLYHFWCSDIKIDAQQQNTAGGPNFFQTDPEAVPHMGRHDPDRPMTHTVFDLLKDHSQHLPSLDQAWIHVQVHNHSNIPADNVNVWILYCRAASGVANLNSRTHMDVPYDFWSQFRADGTIHPNLPEGSPWVAVGPPITLNGVTAARPQVASWNWTVPELAPGDPGHHCVMAFVHSTASPLRESSTEVDVITPRNKQIGQKNLHIGLPLPADGRGGGSGGDTGGAGGASGASGMDEYTEFHNPEEAERTSSLVFDLRSLPPELQVTLRFSSLNTRLALSDSITGAHPTGFGATGLYRFVERFFAWLRNLVRRLFGTPRPPRTRSYAPIRSFGPVVYEADPSALVTVHDVRIPSFDFCASLLLIKNTGSLPSGSEYYFQVKQMMKDKVVGGSVYVVRLAGVPETPVLLSPDEEVEFSDVLKHMPPWIEPLMEAWMRATGVAESSE